MQNLCFWQNIGSLAPPITVQTTRDTKHVMQTRRHMNHKMSQELPIGMHVELCLGGILALRAHCALLLDYVPPEEPLDTPLGNTLRIRRPKLDQRGP